MGRLRRGSRPPEEPQLAAVDTSGATEEPDLSATSLQRQAPVSGRPAIFDGEAASSSAAADGRAPTVYGSRGTRHRRRRSTGRRGGDRSAPSSSASYRHAGRTSASEPPTSISRRVRTCVWVCLSLISVSRGSQHEITPSLMPE